MVGDFSTLDNAGGSAPWNMPELHWAWGYPFALSLMVGLATGFFFFFRRRGFLRPIEGVAVATDTVHVEDAPHGTDLARQLR